MLVIPTFSRARAALGGLVLAAAVTTAACSDDITPTGTTGGTSVVSGSASSLGTTPSGLINLCFTCSLVVERDSLGTDMILTMKSDGTGVKQVGFGTQPSWSPLHDKIVYVSAADIYVMNNDGTGITQLTTDGVDYQPSFTPDGHIVFSRILDDPAGEADIFIMNADGTNPHVIVGGPGYQALPRVSPDGKKIAFSSDEAGAGLMEIYVQDLTTNVRTRVGVSNGSPQTEPAWAPDSKRLAYRTSVASSAQCIAIVNADGTGKKFFPSGLPSCGSPSWSPDGTELAFKTWRLGTYRIARGKVDVASTPVYLTPHSALASDVFLTWSR